MQPRPTSTLILRLLFAILFGVMSVVPVPLRALAHPASMQHAHAAPAAHAARLHAEHAGSHHGHGAAGHHHGDHAAAPPPADGPGAPQPADVLCHSAPCCMAVTQPAPSAPATVLLLLGQLAVPPAQIIVAVTPDPAVPPPRLQA